MKWWPGDKLNKRETVRTASWEDQSEGAARLPEENQHQNNSSWLNLFGPDPAWHIPTSALKAGAMGTVSVSSKCISMNLMKRWAQRDTIRQLGVVVKPALPERQRQ